MYAFALIVFVIRTAVKLAFGPRADITGGSSKQGGSEIAAKPARATMTAGFRGSPLTALCLLCLLVVVRAGPASETARILATGFAQFHGLGALGIVRAALADRPVLVPVLAKGALVTHGGPALGFLLLALVLRLLALVLRPGG